MFSGSRGGILENNGGVAGHRVYGVLLVLFFDGKVEDVLLVARGQTGEHGNDAKETRFTTVLSTIHRHQKTGQPASQSLNSDLKIVVASSHSGGDQVLVLESLGARVLRDEVVFHSCVRATDGKVLGSDAHAMFEGEGDVTDAVPHGVDFEKLSVSREALHLFFPQTIVRESDRASGMKQSGNEIVHRGSGLIELLFLGAVHGLDADLHLQQRHELLSDGRAGGGGSHGDDFFHGGKADFGKVVSFVEDGGVLSVLTNQRHHVSRIETLESRVVLRTVERARRCHLVPVPLAGLSISTNSTSQTGDENVLDGKHIGNIYFVGFCIRSI